MGGWNQGVPETEPCNDLVIVEKYLRCRSEDVLRKCCEIPLIAGKLEAGTLQTLRRSKAGVLIPRNEKEVIVKLLAKHAL
jgi:hypothetical protein